MLGVTYKTAWFMTHRIREAMFDADPDPMGGKGKTVEGETLWPVKRLYVRSVRVKSPGLKALLCASTNAQNPGHARD